MIDDYNLSGIDVLTTIIFLKDMFVGDVSLLIYVSGLVADSRRFLNQI